MPYRDSAHSTKSRLVVAVNGEVASVDRHTGEERWRASIHGTGVGHVTLLVHDGDVYAASGEELVVCLDSATGEKRWEQATVTYGQASLLVDGSDLFVARGSHVQCLDRKTGASRWARTLRGMGKGLTSLALLED